MSVRMALVNPVPRELREVPFGVFEVYQRINKRGRRPSLALADRSLVIRVGFAVARSVPKIKRLSRRMLEFSLLTIFIDTVVSIKGIVMPAARRPMSSVNF